MDGGRKGSVMNDGQIAKLKAISAQDFAALGMHHVVYLRPNTQNGQNFWSVHAADGTEMARMVDREVALAACRQNDLEPVSVH